ncbi:hypothetical protein ACP70R_031802 [Stipagrostis hirtigluma subsp. patula]
MMQRSLRSRTHLLLPCLCPRRRKLRRRLTSAQPRRRGAKQEEDEQEADEAAPAIEAQICRIPKAFSSLSRGAKKEAADENDGSGDESDAETFVSAASADLRSLRTDDDDDGSELPSFRLTPLFFPTAASSALPQPPP